MSPQYEYLVETEVSLSDKDTEEILDIRGAKHWKLVVAVPQQGTVYTKYIYIRPAGDYDV